MTKVEQLRANEAKRLRDEADARDKGVSKLIEKAQAAKAEGREDFARAALEAAVNEMNAVKGLRETAWKAEHGIV